MDQHKLRVIAIDGFDIEPIDAESVILHNGERYDIELTADQHVDNYWVCAQNLEDGVNHFAIQWFHRGIPDILVVRHKTSVSL